jgi:NAD(P)-dependent dehydrogenase (short-subunit alcohol dehydrogenase family)
MKPALWGKTVAITGATGAIAQAAAVSLARDGAHLALMARRKDGLDGVTAAILAEVPEARLTPIVADCTDEAAVKAGLLQAHGVDGRLDGIFATVGGGGFSPLMMLDAATLHAEFDVNVVSAFLAIRHGVPLMQPGGSIVLTSSNSANMPFAYLAGYHIAKSGLEALVRSAAEELGAAGIRVNAIRPGMTRSGATGPMFDDPATLAPFLREYPLGRLGEAHDIAGAVRFLIGPESAWITGQSLAVDGGNELRRNPDLTPMVEAIFGTETVAAARAGKPIDPC